jgi:hypothetical protein
MRARNSGRSLERRFRASAPLGVPDRSAKTNRLGVSISECGRCMIDKQLNLSISLSRQTIQRSLFRSAKQLSKEWNNTRTLLDIKQCSSRGIGAVFNIAGFSRSICERT